MKNKEWLELKETPKVCVSSCSAMAWGKVVGQALSQQKRHLGRSETDVCALQGTSTVFTV